MNIYFKNILMLSTLLLSNTAFAVSNIEPVLIGHWQGQRDDKTTCEFLAWNSEFTSDGRFQITFFADKERKEKIHTEGGTWKANEGKSELSTKGVPTPEVYLYTIIDQDTIKYVNTVRDPSADCKDDYEFIEHRVK